ncbi:hypothetical protein MRX96_032626 [Rhipicephalus microplus]
MQFNPALHRSLGRRRGISQYDVVPCWLRCAGGAKAGATPKEGEPTRPQAGKATGEGDRPADAEDRAFGGAPRPGAGGQQSEDIHPAKWCTERLGRLRWWPALSATHCA